METVYRDYSPKGVRFFYIYKTLAHPELGGYVQPFTLEERLMHVKEAERTLGSKIPWICDSMSNDIKHALGDSPNSEFVIDPKGNIVRVRSWSNPEQLRNDLTELVGPIEKPTKVSDLELKSVRRPQPVARKVVPTIQLPGGLQPVRVDPVSNGSPFYVKLRAEAEEAVLRTGNGKLYLGFHLDPLYHVHWNNLVQPLHFAIETAGPTAVTPATGDGPKVNVDSDTDPREFLVEVSQAEPKTSIELTVKYFACSDDWCKAVTQDYRITFARDRDAGVVMGRNRGPARGNGFGRGPGGGFNPVGGIVNQLNLSDDQETEVNEIRQSYREKLEDLFQQFQEGQIRRPEVQSERQKLTAGLMQDLKPVLNEKQFEQVQRAFQSTRQGARGLPGRAGVGR